MEPLGNRQLALAHWKFLAEHGMRVSDGTPDMALCRESDSLLIDEFVAAGYARETLRTLNRCRFFLRVALLSEVTDGGGNKLRAAMLAGTMPTDRSKYEWPTQGKPPATSWQI